MSALTDYFTQRTQEVFPFARPGSWGTPEASITEFVSDITGSPRTDQGGSQLFGSSPTDMINLGAGWQPLQTSSLNLNTLGESTQNNPSIEKNTGVIKTTTGGGNNNTGNNNTGGGSYPADRYIGWDPVAAQADWDAKVRSGQTGGGGGGGGGNDISDIYAPALSALNDIINTLQGGAESSRQNVLSQYGSGQTKIGNEQKELNTALQEQQRQLAESARSAYAESLRNYNNLIQQGLSRYGAGSSAGPAVQELVNQEFLRSRGSMRNQELSGEQQLAQQQLKINDYIVEKTNELEDWKKDAIFKIDQNLQASLNEISLRKADIEANKTKDKMAALQTAMDNANKVKMADLDYRRSLANFAVEQIQSVMDRALTVPEIAQITGDILKQTQGQFLENTGAAPLSNYRSWLAWGAPGREEEGNI